MRVVELMRDASLKGIHGETLSGAGRLKQEWKRSGASIE